MKVAIAVFAKTPGLSPIKTRLAADLGSRLVEDFYKHSVACIDEILLLAQLNLAEIYKSKINVDVYWALAEKKGSEDAFWNGRNAFWTGDGSFGKRLFQVSKNFLKLMIT